MRKSRVISRLMTLEEYLASEEQNPLRHEYIGGEVFAMAGATTRHNLIVQNLARLLHGPARRRGCHVFAESVRLRAAADRMYYPDILVACGAAANVDHIVEAPSIIVEVTSPATGATDRREKLDAYKNLPALRAYLIVEQRHRRVLVYTRAADDSWVREDVTGDGVIELRALDSAMTLEQIYDDVPMPPLTVGEEGDEDWSS